MTSDKRDTGAPTSAAGAAGAPGGEANAQAYRTLIRNGNYRLWFASALGSGLGDWTGLFALQVLVASLAETGSSLQLFALGGLMMMRLLPSLFLGPVAGVVADRYNRKRLMVVTNVARGLLFLAIAFSGDIVALFALTFVVECLSLLFLSSKDASLPGIVKTGHLPQANQLNLLATYGTLPVGAALATAMIPLAAALRGIGIEGANPTVMALLFNAVTFLVSALLLSRVALPRRPRRDAGAEPRRVIDELKEGWQFIRGLPLIRALITGVVGVFFGGGVVVSLGPVFVQSSLGATGDSWYVMIAVVGVGLACGLASVGAILRRVAAERVFPFALIATAAFVVIMAPLPTFEIALGFGFGLGAAVGISFVLGYTLLQAYTPDGVRARTFATFYTATRAAMFGALGLAPLLAGTVGAATISISGTVFRLAGVRLIIMTGGLLALAAALSAGRSMLRALKEEPDRAVALPPPPPSPTDGVFVALEGVEGSGKSTQAARLAEGLRDEGWEVVVTREPGGTPIGERVRGVLLDPNGAGMDHRAEALLYAAARAEHVAKVIRPGLERGAIVICDRFVDSSLAYQGYGRQLGEDDVFEINRWAIAGVLPDAVVLLRIDPSEGLERVATRANGRRTQAVLAEADPDGAASDWERGAAPDRLEREDMAFHERVSKGFLRMARQDRARYCVVEASGDPEGIARQVRTQLSKWIPLPGERDRTDAQGDRAGRAGDGAVG